MVQPWRCKPWDNGVPLSRLHTLHVCSAMMWHSLTNYSKKSFGWMECTESFAKKYLFIKTFYSIVNASHNKHYKDISLWCYLFHLFLRQRLQQQQHGSTCLFLRSLSSHPSSYLIQDIVRQTSTEQQRKLYYACKSCIPERKCSCVKQVSCNPWINR